MTQMGPVEDCSKAQTLLSDLLDVRRGEQPTPMESPLGNPQVLQSLEEHLGNCAACRQELQDLAELGLAFSEFSLGEPAEAHFAGYGRMVHQRIRRMTQRTAIKPAINVSYQWKLWLSAAATSAAAAVLAVVLLGPLGRTTPDTGNQTETPRIASEEVTAKVEEPTKGILGSEEGLHDQLADALPIIDMPTMQPRSVDINVLTSRGSQLVTFDPRGDQKDPVAGLLEHGRIVLGDPPLNASRSTGLVGIAFAPVPEPDADGLYVVAVKRGGPADAIGLRPEDRLLSVNGIYFSQGSPTEIVKFFNAVSNLGYGKLIQVDFARKAKSGEWLVMRGRAELGKYK